MEIGTRGSLGKVATASAFTFFLFLFSFLAFQCFVLWEYLGRFKAGVTLAKGFVASVRSVDTFCLESVPFLFLTMRSLLAFMVTA